MKRRNSTEQVCFIIVSLFAIFTYGLRTRDTIHSELLPLQQHFCF